MCIASLCALTFLICVVLIRIKTASKLPCLPFVVRSDFQAESVYKFLLTSNRSAWLIAIASGIIHIAMLCIFINASDFKNERSSWEYSFECSSKGLDCEDKRFCTNMGWVGYAIILISFLFVDFADGILMVYESIINHEIKGAFAGMFVFFVTISSLTTSIIYNFSTGVSNTDIILDAAILLFLNEIDEQYYSAIQRIFPSWVEKLEEEISQYSSNLNTLPQSNEDITDKSKNAKFDDSVVDVSSTDSTLGTAAVHIPSISGIGTRPLPARYTESDSYHGLHNMTDSMQKVDFLQQQINRLQIEVDLLRNESSMTHQISRPNNYSYSDVSPAQSSSIDVQYSAKMKRSMASRPRSASNRTHISSVTNSQNGIRSASGKNKGRSSTSTQMNQNINSFIGEGDDSGEIPVSGQSMHEIARIGRF